MSRPLPTIHGREEVDVGAYRLERVDLEFSNGERRRFDRLKSKGHGAVMIAALPDPETVLLIREYGTGTHRYELGLPKGKIDAGETGLEAAAREMREEIGFGAERLTHLKSITLAPTYMSHEIQLVVAEGLFPEKLEGDEPEPLEVVPWRFDRLHELMLREEFSEGRSIAALFLVREWLACGRPTP
ncbi:ADP compounds hydrolase NudE [Silanimonas sp.]|jgi:ADP-ribose diphosphatase|uniref:ADP compounds hydrolase NudE n=1 Tax=Silanimonas sp. TaxID=1929290 RepID=UPI0037C72684